jgi:translation elongation factor EF-1alpha
MPNKKNIIFIVAGHVDYGKSTLCGHILYKTDCICQHDVDLVFSAAINEKMPHCKFSWLLDTSQEERERGKTIKDLNII